MNEFKKILEYLKKAKPEFVVYDPVIGTEMSSVPIEFVKKHYNCLEGLRELIKRGPRDKLEELTIALVEEICDHGGLREDDFGITGSILLKTYSPKSDIDLIVYGIENGKRIYESLKEFRRRGDLRCVKDDYELRKSRLDSSLPLKTWIAAERSKILTGTFSGKIYTAKIVPLPPEYWESLDQECIEIGSTGFIGEVMDDRYSILTPNRYSVFVRKKLFGEVQEGEIVEVFSMRSRFAEMASRGDRVKVVGRLELVKLHGKKWKRVFLGNNEEDVIISLHYI